MTCDNLQYKLLFVPFSFIQQNGNQSNCRNYQKHEGKDKLTINGFIYTMNKSTSELQHWVCEKSGHCKARVTTNANLVIMKLNPEEIQNSHTHTALILLGLKCSKVITK